MGSSSKKPNDDAEAWFNMGFQLGEKGDTKNAMECYDRAIEIDPNLARAWLNKGVLYDNQGDAENAMKCKDKAKELGFHDG